MLATDDRLVHAMRAAIATGSLRRACDVLDQHARVQAALATVVSDGAVFGPAGRAKISTKERAILRLLIERAGEVVSRGDVWREVWPEEACEPPSHKVIVAVSKLRTALEYVGAAVTVETVGGRGKLFLGWRVKDAA